MTRFIFWPVTILVMDLTLYDMKRICWGIWEGLLTPEKGHIERKCTFYLSSSTEYSHVYIQSGTLQQILGWQSRKMEITLSWMAFVSHQIT